jgi:DNA-binding NtrC family response regulator
MTTVLVVDDEKGVREGLCRALTRAGYEALGAEGVLEARARLGEREVDCVLLDVRLKDGDGILFLGELRGSLAREVPVVMATAYGDSERTIAAMKAGAFDYVTKPFDLPVLMATVERAVRQRGLSRAVEAPAAVKTSHTEGALVGASAAMLAVWKVIGRAAASDVPVLITGETGTGKELVARAIHAHSPRAMQPFVAVNLAALPPTLIEAELFGHERGAFTGALARRPGRLELAAGGTLFLDEIGDLDLGLQTRLLRVLQDKRFERVGGTDTLTLDARIIAATHKPVRPATSGTTLREDLYYRLAVVEVELPPLRARKSDIALLVAHALASSPARAVSEAAMEALTRHAWPGNVRELMHVVQRAAVMCGGDVIDLGDLPESVHDVPRGDTHGDDAYDGMTLRDASNALERRLIERALLRAGGNRAEAARMLGIARQQLYAKMDEHGLAGRAKDG